MKAVFYKLCLMTGKSFPNMLAGYTISNTNPIVRQLKVGYFKVAVSTKQLNTGDLHG